MIRSPLSAALLAGVVTLLVTPAAFAAEASPPTDCPPGSIGKASGEFAWCEPTVCQTDAQCSPGQLCRPVKLCLEVGKVSGGKDGGTDKLVATGLCSGADKVCPANTTCSDMKRCLDRGAAQKMNLLDDVKPAPSSGGMAEPVKKSSCGCHVIGTRAESDFSTACALVVGASLLQLARRAARGRSRGSKREDA